MHKSRRKPLLTLQNYIKELTMVPKRMVISTNALKFTIGNNTISKVLYLHVNLVRKQIGSAMIPYVVAPILPVSSGIIQLLISTRTRFQ